MRVTMTTGFGRREMDECEDDECSLKKTCVIRDVFGLYMKWQ